MQDAIITGIALLYGAALLLAVWAWLFALPVVGLLRLGGVLA